MNLRTIASLVFLALVFGCASWVGNPKKPSGGGGTGGNPSTVAGSGKTSSSELAGHQGDVFFQKLVVQAGTAVHAALTVSRSTSLADDGPLLAPYEISVLGDDGSEVQYDRKGISDVSVDYTPKSDGTMIVALKTNDPSTIDLAGAIATGATKLGEPVAAAARVDAPYANVLLKSVVALARQCLTPNPTNGHNDATAAPSGRVFVQPFVFLGQVGADKKVTPLAKATITISAGGETVTLKRLEDIAAAKYSTDTVRGGAAVQLSTFRSFYEGYLGGAGQLYTIDGFYGGFCDDVPSLPLDGTDPGTAVITLGISDETLIPVLNKSFPVRATLQPPFETYVSDGVQLNDYTLCDYDRITGEPVPFAGSAPTCKQFSLASPPYDIGGALPSKSAAGATTVSDPTRIFFYGSASPKAWIKTLVADHDALIGGTKTAETLTGCLNTGGIVSLPINDKRNYVPLAEFNATEGDVITVARRTGSYTVLTEFYQGDIDGSEATTVNTCVHDSAGSCYPTTINVTTSNCTIKADSGVSALSLSDSLVYPGYYEMSGVVAP